ncbi:hypothetical protein LX32DRAFT_634995 [Colletotrichum zoysiae]|uniref:Uncharacterized protein n=1 Tax=Colletotrichum zoysiae TaxID=1216348 RepID=A0AAD9M571_9PEZI|nr:hypothetical protein LX32DRAFT_634995 [Colletotrichum zoysiae]
MGSVAGLTAILLPQHGTCYRSRVLAPPRPGCRIRIRKCFVDWGARSLLVLLVLPLSLPPPPKPMGKPTASERGRAGCLGRHGRHHEGSPAT